MLLFFRGRIPSIFLDASSRRARLFFCFTPCCQAWSHDVVASPPTGTNTAMAVRGGTRHPTRPMYRPPPIAGPIIGHHYAQAATNAPDRRSAVVHEQGRPSISRRYAPAGTNSPTRKPAVMYGQGGGAMLIYTRQRPQTYRPGSLPPCTSKGQFGTLTVRCTL